MGGVFRRGRGGEAGLVMNTREANILPHSLNRGVRCRAGEEQRERRGVAWDSVIADQCSV